MEKKGDELASALQMAAAAALNGPVLPSDATHVERSSKMSEVLKSSGLYAGNGEQRAAFGEKGRTAVVDTQLPEVLDAFQRVDVSDTMRISSHQEYMRGDRMVTPKSSGHWQSMNASPDARRQSQRGSIDIPRIEVVRPSQQDPMAMEKMSYEHTGPPTIIRDADGQEYLVQPVRESLDLDRNVQVGSYQGSSLSGYGSTLTRQSMQRRSVDELYSPFGGPVEEKTATATIGSDGTGQSVHSEQERQGSRFRSNDSTGNVGVMYLNSLRHSCPVSIEVRNSLLSPLGSVSRSGSLHDTNVPSTKHDGDDEWEISFSDLIFGQRIGRGAYGEVFRGLYRETEVAIKVFLEQDVSEKVLEAFKKEVAILKKLRHPNIVQFMGACTQPLHLCIVSEYEPNGSLFMCLHRSDVPLSLDNKIQIALDTAIGMNYLHTSKPPIIHGDLKSANLLLTHDFHVKVCDFGLSRVKLSAKLSIGSKLGTPEWTAPEVLKHSASNEASDVYSFGVVLWEIFVRKIPWEEVNPMQVIIMVGFHDERLQIPDDIPEWARDLIHDCFKSAEERPLFRDIIVRLRSVRASLESR